MGHGNNISPTEGDGGAPVGAVPAWKRSLSAGLTEFGSSYGQQGSPNYTPAAKQISAAMLKRIRDQRAVSNNATSTQDDAPIQYPW